jgi:hypothetical protein
MKLCHRPLEDGAAAELGAEDVQLPDRGTQALDILGTEAGSRAGGQHPGHPRCGGTEELPAPRRLLLPGRGVRSTRWPGV